MVTPQEGADLAARIAAAVAAADAAAHAGTITPATGPEAVRRKHKAAAWAERVDLTGWCYATRQADWRPGFLPDKPDTGLVTRRLYALAQARLQHRITATWTPALEEAFTPRTPARVPLARPPFVQESAPVHGYTSGAFFVIHCTEDALPLENLFRYFRGTSDGLGVQYAIDPAGVLAIAAGPHEKTYHVASHNSECVGVELTGFDGTDWANTRKQQMEMLSWLLAWHCRELGVPLVQAANERRIFTRPRGVLQHRWCPDNDHSDCGPRFPFAAELARAADYQRNGLPSDAVARRQAARRAHRPGVAGRP